LSAFSRRSARIADERLPENRFSYLSLENFAYFPTYLAGFVGRDARSAMGWLAGTDFPYE
jgi:hypothetical protein